MKILGLDLGTNSIGWAVIDKDKNKILNAGVRIFPAGVEEKTIGMGEKEQSRNATRREKRQMRRHFYRKRIRKIKLLEVLIEQGMCPLALSELKKWKNWNKQDKTEGRRFPQTEDFNRWLGLNPYDLRSRAISESITLHELGRIFYHFIQRRGFLSSRKGNEDPKTIYEKGKPEENILPINATKDKIKNSSLGDYLNKISYRENETYQKITDEKGNEIRIRGRYTTRDMYIAEFEKIWNVQSKLSDINDRKIKVKKIREFKGPLEGRRNANRISFLKQKYGEENVMIGETNDRGHTKITTIKSMPFKQFLAGDIQHITDENGEDLLRFRSNESVLFWQRALRSQKSLLSNCRFEDQLPVIKADGSIRLNTKGEIQTRSKKPCPISHPDFELFRTYQFINNIKYGKELGLTEEQKKVVLRLINKNDKNFDFEKIPKELKLTYEKFNYDNKHKVPGNTTIKQLLPLFDDLIWEKHYDEIWHCFYFYDDNDKLYAKLKKDFNYNGEIEAIKKVKLKEGYGNISLNAIRNILPFLIRGHQYDRAVILGGVKNAFGKRWEYFQDYHTEIEKGVINVLKQDNKEGEAIENIKHFLSSPSTIYGFSANDPRFFHLYHHSQEVGEKEELDEWVPQIENLRNPIVQQGLHETRRLVNALLRKYRKQYGDDFHFDQIKIEMGRDLRNSKKQRQDLSIRIRQNESKNEDARQRLAEYGLQPSRTNIQKYLMYQEIEDKAGKGVCPYTGKIISINDLLGSGNAIQIEHIIPFSISLDDSYINKTLCEANFNRDKGEKTPYQFYKENPDPKLWNANSWAEVEMRAFQLLPYTKAKRFTAKKEFERSSFIERQLNDSRYIARKSVEMLSNICRDVRVMPGQLTAELRHLWGLNNILQPVRNVDLDTFEVDKEQSIPYYVVMNAKNEVQSLRRITNPKPTMQSQEILLAGTLVKNVFSSNFYKTEILDHEYEDGKYWAKLKVDNHIQLFPKFVEKPNVDQGHIIFRGKVEKGLFRNDTIGNVKTDHPDGSYWAIFKVINRTFVMPEKDKQPKAKRHQVILFGSVADGEFKSFIYQCNTDLPDGKYWIIIDLAFAEIEYLRAINPVPDIHDHQLLISATINESGMLTADNDKDFQVSTDAIKGKYYASLSIETENLLLLPMENEPPKLDKYQKLVEGNVWADKYTGEIKFDPKKNRDDHRHHAIDAITIALTEQGYLQRLSTYNAQRKEKERGHLNSTENYPEPWGDFSRDVKKSIHSILISHKKNNKALTKNRKGFSVRGQLHKENVFGQRQAPNQSEGFHRRTKITDLKDHKHVGKVVDDTIRKLIIDHLRDNCGVDTSNTKGFGIPKDAFNKDGQWRLFLPNRKGGDPVPVKKVRIKKSLGNAVQLKSDINQYVDPRNNHHVLIYKDFDGNLQEQVAQFWTVVERKLQGLPPIQLPEDGKEIITTLEINDMFLLGLSNDEFALYINNHQLLAQHLYRVQKISESDYTFRFHLASTLLNAEEEYRIVSFKAWEKANPIKVKVNALGEVVLP